MPIFLIILELIFIMPMFLSDTKIEGWPELVTTEHIVSTKEVGDACQLGMCGIVLGCSKFNLYEKTCEVWVTNETPSWQNILEHERLHCQGYAHANNLFGCGGDNMQEYFDKWKLSVSTH